MADDKLITALENALEALRNVAPKHMIKGGCFNRDITFDGPCPCTLCVGKRAIAQARKEVPSRA